MVTVTVPLNLKGVVRVRNKSGAYFYFGRRGPRLPGEPGSPEFMSAYNKASEQLILSRVEASLFAERESNKANYLSCGRRFQSLTDASLKQRWIKRLRQTLSADRRHRTELDDLGGEISLRNITNVKLPPDVIELIGARARVAG